MPQYIDSYFLVESRNSASIKNFINAFLPLSKLSTDDYPVPWFSKSPSIIFKEVEELIDYLEQNVNLEYSIYWENLDIKSIIQYFMVFYTDDGKMIFGVSVVGNNPQEMNSIILFKKIKKFLNSNICCMTVEEVPPTNSKEFLEFSKKRFVPN